MVLPKHIAAVLGGTWQHLNSTRVDFNGTALAPGPLGLSPIGLLTYNPDGYMSAHMVSSDPGHIPPVRDPEPPTYEDFALVGEHSLVYAGELHVAWENSTATSGRLTHGPLKMASLASWIETSQPRNYEVTLKAHETGGRDVLRLWARDEGRHTVSTIWWVRAPPT
ncbi:hypothetical protein CC86DRAFT_470819 [Ophiobolus disseminans]|uniref:Lipocalin-like domain-containing protein n=1 Tax=Ophiobolus disseminans TaxID=1469910 RepID=A0A6A6ZIU9_9PLEO|nr:hypothetical protein CC86DRAFT_470819 [Ophiobolus disseminans]